MSKKVIIKREGKEDKEIPFQESSRSGMNWHVRKGSDGFHFKSYDSLKEHYQRLNPKAEITISK